MSKLREKGITLVALVVTIIILLILAGVTIAQISGNNGLFSRVKQVVEGYKNAQIDEESKLTEVEKYLSEFEILGGNKTDDDVKVKIINFTSKSEEKNIEAKVEIEGKSSKIQFSLDGEEWVNDENNINNTEYTFKEVKIGSYNVRVRVYDEEGKKTEAMSNLITVVDESITLAKEEDVLSTKTYYDGNRELHTGTLELGKRLKRINLEETPGTRERTVDVKSILPNNYRELTDDNFALIATNIYILKGEYIEVRSVDIKYSYDPETGILSIGGSFMTDGLHRYEAGTSVMAVCFYIE